MIYLLLPLLASTGLVVYRQSFHPGLVYVQTGPNEGFYVKAAKDQEKAAQILSKIKSRADLLIRSLPDDTTWSTLKRNYEQVTYQEAMSAHMTSYTWNKQAVHMCIRHRKSDGGCGDNVEDNQLITDIDLLMQVLIHELAHIAMKQFRQDHPPEFVNIYELLLYEASRLGLIKESGRNRRAAYCGLCVKKF